MISIWYVPICSYQTCSFFLSTGQLILPHHCWGGPKSHSLFLFVNNKLYMVYEGHILVQIVDPGRRRSHFSRKSLMYQPMLWSLQFFVLRDYARETLSLRWRSWMTSYYMERYLKNRTFYKIQSQSIIDNPDQRIVDDLSSFTGTALSFSLTLFNAIVDLISFSNILYGIYPPLFVVLLVYSIGGTAISVFLGKVIFFCYTKQ